MRCNLQVCFLFHDKMIEDQTLVDATFSMKLERSCVSIKLHHWSCFIDSSVLYVIRCQQSLGLANSSIGTVLGGLILLEVYLLKPAALNPLFTVATFWQLFGNFFSVPSLRRN